LCKREKEDLLKGISLQKLLLKDIGKTSMIVSINSKCGRFSEKSKIDAFNRIIIFAHLIVKGYQIMYNIS
jgi:hypothetical protein